VDVDIADRVRMAVWRKQTVDQRLQAVGLMDDDVGVFLELGIGQLQLQ